MASTSKQASDQVKKSWARAKNLATMADVKPAQARSFLKDNKEYCTLLDVGCDKRSPTARKMIQDCQTHTATYRGRLPRVKTKTDFNQSRETSRDTAMIGLENSNLRASHGDNTCTPRAGAPDPIKIACTETENYGSLEESIQALQAWKNRHDALGQKIQDCINSLQNDQWTARCP